MSIGEERRVYHASVFEREVGFVASGSGAFVDSSGDGRGKVQALKTLRGGLSNDVKEARGRMIDVLAELEARLDFDDEMVPLDVDKIAKEVDEAKEVALSALKTSQKNASLSVGCTLAILSDVIWAAGENERLLNRWTKSERSIVTDVEGTTREMWSRRR